MLVRFIFHTDQQHARLLYCTVRVNTLDQLTSTVRSELTLRTVRTPSITTNFRREENKQHTKNQGYHNSIRPAYNR